MAEKLISISPRESLKDLIGAVNRQITVENPEDGRRLLQDQGFRSVLQKAYAANRPSASGRHVAGKNLTSQSYPSIGEAFGGRDHTTVLHAVRTIESLRAKDNELNQ